MTASILPIALQLDWLALVDDRYRLAAALLLARPLAFLALLALLPDGPGTPAVAGCFLAAWLLAALASWAALDRPGASAPARCRARRRCCGEARRWRS